MPWKLEHVRFIDKLEVLGRMPSRGDDSVQAPMNQEFTVRQDNDYYVFCAVAATFQAYGCTILDSLFPSVLEPFCARAESFIAVTIFMLTERELGLHRYAIIEALGARDVRTGKEALKQEVVCELNTQFRSHVTQRSIFF
jgi:hypothetical protein